MGRVVVLGGTGAMGAAVSGLLRDRGHDVVVASRATGVDVSTGAGLDEALAGADTVVDCLNVTTMSKRTAVSFFAGAATERRERRGNGGRRPHRLPVDRQRHRPRRAPRHRVLRRQGRPGGGVRRRRGATDPRSHDGVVQPRRDLPVTAPDRAGRRRPRNAAPTRAPRRCRGLRRGCRRVRPPVRLTSQPSARGASARRPGAARRGGDGARGGAHPASGGARGPPPAADGRAARGAAPRDPRSRSTPARSATGSPRPERPERRQKVSPVSRS